MLTNEPVTGECSGSLHVSTFLWCRIWLVKKKTRAHGQGHMFVGMASVYLLFIFCCCSSRSTVCFLALKYYNFVVIALFVWMQCSAIGASFCYLLSYLVGRRIVWRYMPERAIEWSTHVMFTFCLCYRVFIVVTWLGTRKGIQSVKY